MHPSSAVALIWALTKDLNMNIFPTVVFLFGI